MNLRDLQLALLPHVMSPLPADEGLALAAKQSIAKGKRTEASQLGTYREQYWLRHFGSLDEDFPTVRALLGETSFERATAAFLAAFPPTSPLLGEASRLFPAFLGTYLPTTESLAVEAAQLEWATLESGLADDATPVSAARITSIQEAEWPSARFRFHPALRLIRLSARLHRYRSELLQATDRPRGWTPQLVREPAQIVVERRDTGAIMYEEAASLEFELLETLMSGDSLGDACSRLADKDPPLAEWFQRWMSHGWIMAIDLPDDAK